MTEKLLFKRLREETKMSKDKNKQEHKHCELCFLSNENNPKVKFHLYDDGTFSFPGEKYICDKCLNWVHLMRKTAAEQAKKPEDDAFEDVTWWWQPKKEGSSAAEMQVK